MNRTYDDVLADLAQMLANFEGKEYSGEIGAQTQFFGELGYASIDAVVLSEKLEEFYGQKFPFHEFIADLRERDVDDIEVGRLAEFLHRHLS
ncbi:MAG: phosphopantetheine-binding protein [Pirellulaceae bacterium]